MELGQPSPYITFPFSRYDACVSMATIDNIPANHVTKVEAMFALYATLCGNLSQITRKFLFSKFEIQCSCCTQKFEVSVDIFHATISSTTGIEMLTSLLRPMWNREEIQERQACSCLELDKITWRCLKLGPLSLIRLEAAKGAHLPKVEDALLTLGQQFLFQTRNYEVHCLITTNRLDQDSQLIILHANQPGMVAMYDHNNGLRIVETERVNDKLIIVGVLALPVKSQKAILTTKELVTVAGAVEATRYQKKRLKVVKGILKSPRKRHRLSSKSPQATANKTKLNAGERKAKTYKSRRKHREDEPKTLDAIDLDGLPRTGLASECQAQVGVISMFDWVGSVYHIIKKKLGKPPTIYIAAETDPVLRRLVSAELGLREDQQWGLTVEGVTTLYVKDVWELLSKDALILRQAKAMYPHIKWILIAGSPCQDLTYAGYLNGLLGLTGRRSMLFFVVYVVLCHLQELFGFDAVRFLTENAGSMQIVQCNRKSNARQSLEQSEHFQMFLYCLGLLNKQPVKQWIWDTSSFYGIRRKRVFLHSHLDTAVPSADPAPGDDTWGPLIYLDNRISPLAPLLRTRGYTPGGALKLSWTGYQPCALMWNYAFFGGKRSFALLCQLAGEDKVPKLHWASIVPAHFLPIWRSFIATLQAEKTAATRKDELIDQLIPIFHNPNISLPMRILSVQEVRKLSGLDNVLTTERHGPTLLTEQVVRDFCGNSFHPGLIDAALGTDVQLQQWVLGNNDAQPCHEATPPIQEAYDKYQQLLRLVLEQGAKRGVQLKADRVDFEAKWRSSTLNEHVAAAQVPTVQQPTVFSFLQATKTASREEAQRRTDTPFGDSSFSDTLVQANMEWLRKSSTTYENVTLSARMIKLAVECGIGSYIEVQSVRTKYAALLQEYTAEEKLAAISQFFTIPQVATFGSTHRFPYGFIIWAPKLFQPPLIYVGAQKPCLLFLVISQDADQPFQFGTAAYDYLQETDFLVNCNIPRLLADVVQLTNIVMTPYPLTVRIEEGKQFVHLSEFATIYCPFCPVCFISTFGARSCFMHTAGASPSIPHLFGGLDGTGGLSLIGSITATPLIAAPDWIVIHVVDNEQVQGIIDSKVVSTFRNALPLLWSPAWYSHHNLSRPTSRHLGKKEFNTYVIDGTGEYLIFSGTEEWSRLLVSLAEAPPEATDT